MYKGQSHSRILLLTHTACLRCGLRWFLLNWLSLGSQSLIFSPDASQYFFPLPVFKKRPRGRWTMKHRISYRVSLQCQCHAIFRHDRGQERRPSSVKRGFRSWEELSGVQADDPLAWNPRAAASVLAGLGGSGGPSGPLPSVSSFHFPHLLWTFSIFPHRTKTPKSRHQRTPRPKIGNAKATQGKIFRKGSKV